MASTTRAARWTPERTIEVAEKDVSGSRAGRSAYRGRQCRHLRLGPALLSRRVPHTAWHHAGARVRRHGDRRRRQRPTRARGRPGRHRAPAALRALPVLHVRRLPRLQRPRARGRARRRRHERGRDRPGQHGLQGALGDRRRSRRPGGTPGMLGPRLRKGEAARPRDGVHRRCRFHRSDGDPGRAGPAAPAPSSWPGILTSRRPRADSARSR